VYVGYKGYQAREIEPQFPFGYVSWAQGMALQFITNKKIALRAYSFGLSYTTFSYDNLLITLPQSVPNASALNIEVSLTVTNTGNNVGTETVQLYIKLAPAKVRHPTLQLRAFAKVHDLAPGSSRKVTMHLDKHALAFYDDLLSTWRVEKGEYGVFVGSSSSDLPLHGTFKLKKGYEWIGL
jgi:beta-glucosidase